MHSQSKYSIYAIKLILNDCHQPSFNSFLIRYMWFVGISSMSTGIGGSTKRVILSIYMKIEYVVNRPISNIRTISE
jgi:hypothetical protein